MFKDENTRKNEVNLRVNLRTARVSATIMTVLILFNFFCALSPFDLELVGVILTTVFLFIYVKFSIACSELKDLGYNRIWVKLYRIAGLALYLVSALLCMLGIG